MLRATGDHRRARIGRRHGLQPEHRHDDIRLATEAMTAWHATEPATPHLALHARTSDLTIGDVEAALYDERSLVKTMAMRRTLFVVKRELLPAVAGSAGRRVADRERRRLVQELAGPGRQVDDGWIQAACRDVVACLTEEDLSVRELRDALPELGGTFTAAPGTKWSTEVPMMSRLVTILGAAGEVVRGRNAGHWRISRPRWTSTASWLGEPVTPAEPDAGWAEVVRHWLWTFGPGTENDLVWWLGSTRTVIRRALADVDAVPVALDDGATGWVLADDTADLETPPSREPWVALLPTLDPTTMGWRDRGFYLDPTHTPYLFDSAGNGGTTVWVNGHIVGSWVQDERNRVVLVLRTEASRETQRLLDADVARLEAFVAGERITNVYAATLMKGQRIG